MSGQSSQAIATWKERKKTQYGRYAKKGGRRKGEKGEDKGSRERGRKGEEGGEGRIQNAGVIAQEVNLAETFSNKRTSSQTSYYRGRFQ